MKSFEFLQPSSLDEALAAWRPGAAWLGGGTNLVDLMKTGALQPELVIDIKRVPGLDAVERLDDGGLRIGALVTNAALAAHPEILSRCPMLAEALLSGASGQLRNAATVAGNLAQHPRDAFSRDIVPPADPLAGGGAGLSILGAGGRAVAVNPSDFCVPLVALDAVVEIRGPDGPREIAVADLHPPSGPGGAPVGATATTLAPGELITALRLPAGISDFAAHARYLKVRDRTSFAFAMASAAAALRIEGGRITDARLALGAVAPKPWRLAEAEALMTGQAPDPALFERVAEAALAGATPQGGNGWKIRLARRTAARALSMAASGTPARMPALPASPFGDMAGETAYA